mgnify:CR=1 FL=1
MSILRSGAAVTAALLLSMPSYAATPEDGHADEKPVDDGHDHGDDDPHIWGDALLVAEATRIIGATLAGLRHEGASRVS